MHKCKVQHPVKFHSAAKRRRFCRKNGKNHEGLPRKKPTVGFFLAGCR